MSHDAKTLRQVRAVIVEGICSRLFMVGRDLGQPERDPSETRAGANARPGPTEDQYWPHPLGNWGKARRSVPGISMVTVPSSRNGVARSGQRVKWADVQLRRRYGHTCSLQDDVAVLHQLSGAAGLAGAALYSRVTRISRFGHLPFDHREISSNKCVDFAGSLSWSLFSCLRSALLFGLGPSSWAGAAWAGPWPSRSWHWATSPWQSSGFGCRIHSCALLRFQPRFPSVY